MKEAKKIDDKLERAVKVSELLKNVITYDIAEDSKGINGFDILRKGRLYNSLS